MSSSSATFLLSSSSKCRLSLLLCSGSPLGSCWLRSDGNRVATIMSIPARITLRSITSFKRKKDFYTLSKWNDLSTFDIYFERRIFTHKMIRLGRFAWCHRKSLRSRSCRRMRVKKCLEGSHPPPQTLSQWRHRSYCWRHHFWRHRGLWTIWRMTSHPCKYIAIFKTNDSRANNIYFSYKVWS